MPRGLAMMPLYFQRSGETSTATLCRLSLDLRSCLRNILTFLLLEILRTAFKPLFQSFDLALQSLRLDELFCHV
jgi:hypothetical protein